MTATIIEYWGGQWDRLASDCQKSHEQYVHVNNALCQANVIHYIIGKHGSVVIYSINVLYDRKTLVD